MSSEYSQGDNYEQYIVVLPANAQPLMIKIDPQIAEAWLDILMQSVLHSAHQQPSLLFFTPTGVMVFSILVHQG